MGRDSSKSFWIAVVLLTAVLSLGLYQIRVWVSRLDGKVERIAQANLSMDGRLEALLEEVRQLDRKPQNEQPAPAEAIVEPPAPAEKDAADENAAANEALRNYKIYYRISAREDLSQIGRKFGVSVDQLCSWNGIMPTDLLQIGQVLVVHPRRGELQRGSTERLVRVAQKKPQEKTPAAAKIEKPELKEKPHAPELAPGGEKPGTLRESSAAVPAQKTAESEPTPREKAVSVPQVQVSHTVRAGENLYRIGLAYGLTWKEVAEANGISDPARLTAGKVLKIPIKNPADQP